MKLACASGAFHRAITSGELTQLEFLDLCARELACDGVVLDARHFPRSDDDYLAQLKKLSADWGISIAALSDPDFFRSEGDRMTEMLRLAIVLGAPLIAAPLAGETECPWSAQLARLGEAAALAKRLNVTLALRNAPGTFAAGVADCKRVSKETDSAWLRYGPDPQAFEAADDPPTLAGSAVLLWSRAGADVPGIAQTIEWFPAFRGFVALDDPAGAVESGAAGESLARWRDALCGRRKELNHK